MKADYGDDLEIPVLYFSQLFGLALGFSPKELVLRRHFTSPMPMLAQRGLV
jgi:heterodisulfide reductase subunit B